ncbi:phage tail protein [Cronobacter sakazakii]
MSAGVIQLTHNSATVLGYQASFSTVLQPGDFVVSVVGGIAYTLPVKSIESNDSLTLVSAFTGPTTNNLAWDAVSRVTLNMVTAAMVVQNTEALRGLNYDKQNWQQVYSGAGSITVKLPDGNTFTGPSWKYLSDNMATKSGGAVPIGQGGTGSTDVAGARTNLELGSAATKNIGLDAGDVMGVGGFGIGRPDGVIRVNNINNVTDLANSLREYGLVPFRSEKNIPGTWGIYNYAPSLFLQTVDTLAILSLPFNAESPVRILGGGSDGIKTARTLWDDINTTVDSNGFIKRASPVVKIFADGTAEMNGESEGCKVSRISAGNYLISGCNGLNADAAWGGIDGGFEIPVDRNKQPRIWLDYKVNADGSVLVRTYHRVHTSAPTFAQNRIGNTDINGVFTETVADGEPVDIPADSFVSVRVEMPEDSIWNRMQKETREAIEKAERERQQNQQDTKS